MQRHQLKALLWVLIALFLPTLGGLAAIDASLRVPASPAGIVSFEFCGFTSSCEAALDQWGVAGRQFAMLSLGVDYLFMVIYPSLVCVGLLLVAPLASVRLRKFTVLLAWFALGAGLADALENFFLIRVVLDGSGATHGYLAGVCAVVKFAILGITLGWLPFAALAPGRRGPA